MSKATHADLGWEVLAHPTGEVLTAATRAPGLHLGLLGVPQGFASQDTERWLADVGGVARESGATQPATGLIPVLLHQALSGLLFSHAELWDQPGVPAPCSFAFVEGPDEIGFGWVGEARVGMWVDGEPHEPGWITVRDETGREAHAWSIATRHEVEVRISWGRRVDDPGAGGAEVEAVWRPAERRDDRYAPHAEETGVDRDDLARAGEEQVDIILVGPDYQPLSDQDPADDLALADAPEGAESAAGMADSAEQGAPARAAGGNPFARWWRGLTASLSGRGRRGGEEPSESPAAAHPSLVIADLIPPSPEPEELTRSSEPELSLGIAPVWRDGVTRIPSTPEALELTERAAPWWPPADPHAIELPPPSVEPRQPQIAISEQETRPVSPAIVETPMVEQAVAAEEEVVEPAGSTAMAADVSSPSVEPTLRFELPPTSAARRELSADTQPQHPAWPSLQELARSRLPLWRRPWLWVAVVVALFGGGWLVGSMQDNGRPRDAASRGAMDDALRAVGLGGPRFVVQVKSSPAGAWMSVDGQALALRTPAAVEMKPGEHTIGLAFSEYGGETYPVRGREGERVALNATLWGALEVFSPNEVGVVAVAVDGVPRGVAPLRVDSLTPGVHELRFSGPGVPSWGQTVDVRVGETHELLARAVQSPASGVLQVEASLADEQGTQPLKGGQVWVDGEPRGTTPLTLDLPRGPHSVRLVYKGQEAPIQVIDLPGGNQRFAVFEFGLDQDVPRLGVDAPARIPRDRPAVISGTLAGVAASEVSGMWLHARIADGPWQRYAMTILKTPSGAVGVAPFPTAAFDAQGRARYYLRAEYGQGDESFTEIRTIGLEGTTGR